MIIVITGPTAVGKTRLSIELARKYDGEIINADSVQVYKGIDIASAKIKDDEKMGIPHYLLDIKNINEDYTIYNYQNDCRKKIDDILKRGKTPIIVGGSGLYIMSALYDYKLEDERVKNHDLEGLSNDELYSKLISIDPNSLIHKNNRRRMIRYIEKSSNNEIKNSASPQLLYDTIFIGLTTNRQELYERINKRVDLMIEEGLLGEAKRIYDTNIRTKAVLTPIGYKELFPYFEGKEDLNTAIDNIKKNSRHYAKRQYTWFNNKMDINWFEVDFNNFDNTVMDVIKFIDNKKNNSK